MKTYKKPVIREIYLDTEEILDGLGTASLVKPEETGTGDGGSPVRGDGYENLSKDGFNAWED